VLRKNGCDVAVWTHAKQADVEHDIVELSRVRLGGLIKVETGVAGRHFVNPIRVQLQRLSEHVKSLLRIPIWTISGHETLISPPELDPRPVDGRVRSFVAKSRIGPGGNAPTGEGELGNPEVSLDLGESRH
jgi:hypothetical protein